VQRVIFDAGAAISISAASTMPAITIGSSRIARVTKKI